MKRTRIAPTAGQPIWQMRRRGFPDTDAPSAARSFHLPLFERARIVEALAKVNGKVTHAAELLGMNYQKLAYIIETRHPDLLKKRTPVRRRPRKGTRKKHR